jgi:methionine-rich copper-binding protein CopC
MSAMKAASPMIPKIRTVLLALAIILTGAAAASAHVVLKSADPPAGSAVSVAPKEVRLVFSEALEPAFSRAQVVGPDGQRVDIGSRVDPAAPNVLRVALRPLVAGSYRVVWRVVSTDTHVTSGNFTFTVGG